MRRRLFPISKSSFDAIPFAAFQLGKKDSGSIYVDLDRSQN